MILKMLTCHFQIIKQPFQICMKPLALVPVISHSKHAISAAAVTRYWHYFSMRCWKQIPHIVGKCVYCNTCSNDLSCNLSLLTGLLCWGVEAVCVPMSPRALWWTSVSCCWLPMLHAVWKLPRLVSIFMCHLSTWKQPIPWVLLSRRHNVRC